jgi:uncharacterized damage-inducible protein DinB
MKTISELFLAELEAEERATRQCIERVPESLFSFKPHERSMKMGDLIQMLADLPKFITAVIKVGEINFATWEHYTPATTAELLKRFDQNMADVKAALKDTTDQELREGVFVMKSGEQELSRDSKEISVSSLINHWVHHRGQLTVYLRLNDIPVPSIYGPSADEKMS